MMVEKVSEKIPGALFEIIRNIFRLCEGVLTDWPDSALGRSDPATSPHLQYISCEAFPQRSLRAYAPAH